MTTENGILSNYIPRKALADAIGYREETLIRWEKDGKGPPATRVGRQVLYLKTSVDKWLRSLEGKAA